MSVLVKTSLSRLYIIMNVTVLLSTLFSVTVLISYIKEFMIMEKQGLLYWYWLLILLSGIFLVMVINIFLFFHFKRMKSPLADVFNFCPIAMVIVDPNGIIQRYNEAFFDLIKRLTEKERQIIGISIYEIFNEKLLDKADGVMPDALQGKMVKQKYIKVMGKKFLATASPIKDGNAGGIRGAIAVYYEITEYEKLCAELSRMDRLNLLGETAASLAHEIRNPITTIKGYLQLMARKGENKERFEILLGELNRAHELIEEYLLLARNKPLQKTPKSMNAIIHSIYPLLYADTVKLSIQLQLDLEEDLPDLRIDERELKQLILNLCRNAADATMNKGKIIIRTKRGRDFVCLEVEDDGCGIPEECLEKVTEPFYTTKGNGTGLGLAVCRNIADQHHAKLWIRSVLKKGTTVSVRFPIEKE